MEKIKPFITSSVDSEKGKDILIVIIVILVGLSSFELGRLSNNPQTSGIKIEYPDQGASAVSALESLTNPEQNSLPILETAKNLNSVNSAGKTFFASNRGSKYYSLGCSAGKNLKMENRIYFSTKEEAERAGYQLSSSCK